MEVKVIAFGIAKDILKSAELKLEIEGTIHVGDVRSKLISLFPDFIKLKSLRFAVNEDYQDDSYIISENDELVIIPPVSGG